MKNSRRCPKCGGADIICCRTSTNGAYDKIQKSLFSAAGTDRWVCCTCGYCELWVDVEGLEEIRTFWGKPENS